MLSLRMSYLRFVLAVGLFSIAGRLSSQEMAIDTLEYLSHYLSETLEDRLNYNLMIASSKGYVSEIHRLIRKGADIECKTIEGTTPLLFAVANNKTDAVKALLSYKPDVNIITSEAETPLLVAVKNGNLDISETLIRDSANIDFSDKYGATPLHYASIYGYFYIVDMLLYYEAINDKRTKDGITPLMAAIWAGYDDIADLLIQNSADIEAKDIDGFTPFLIAAQNGDTIAMELLLKNGVNLYETNIYNYNALEICIKFNHKPATEYLLEKGDKWASKEQGSVGSYAVASKYMRKEIIAILEKNKIPRTYRLGIDQVSVSPSVKFNNRDYFTGISLTFKEPYINGGIIFGYDVKLWYTREIIRKSENTFYQYMDKRSVVYAGLFKDLSLSDNPLKGNWDFTTSLLIGYNFGNKFKGTQIAPERKVKIIPAAGFKWTRNNFNFFGRIEYMNTEFYKNGPIWLRIGGSYNLFFDKIRAPGKIIKWY